MRKRIIRSVGGIEARHRERERLYAERERQEEQRRLKSHVLQDEAASPQDPAYPLIVRFCLYRERCSSEIRGRLYEMGVDEATTEKYLTFLREERYYDDARFCREYAYGKMRSRGWGRKKIRHELESRYLDKADVEAALAGLDIEMYEKQMKKAAKEKLAALPESLDRRQLVFRHLKSRGYTGEEIVRLLDILPETTKKK
jgi:regulatory protein